MLLKLDSIAPPREFTKGVDPYVPFELELANASGSADELFYWRSTDSKYLLEAKIPASTGMLGGVALVLVPREWVKVVDLVSASCAAPSTNGIPIVDLTPWRSKLGGREMVDPSLRRIDEEQPFVFAIGRDGIAVLFDSGTAASTVTNGDLKFLFAEDSVLCGIVRPRRPIRALTSPIAIAVTRAPAASTAAS